MQPGFHRGSNKEHYAALPSCSNDFYLVINKVILATVNVLCNAAIILCRAQSQRQDRELNVLYSSVV